MGKTVFASLVLGAVIGAGVLGAGPVQAQTAQDFCATGPYQFDNVVAGLGNNMNSVRSQISAFGYQARNAGCQISVQCAAREASTPADRPESNREANQICAATVQMLNRIGFIPPRGNSMTTAANVDRNREVSTSRAPATPAFPVGSVLVHLSVPGQ